nr:MULTISPECIES: hypothetical protein [Listeria]
MFTWDTRMTRKSNNITLWRVYGLEKGVFTAYDSDPSDEWVCL